MRERGWSCRKGWYSKHETRRLGSFAPRRRHRFIEDEKIEDSYDLFRALDKHVVGDSVKISVFRDTDRKVLDFIVKLDDIKDMETAVDDKKFEPAKKIASSSFEATTDGRRAENNNNNNNNNNNGDDGFLVPPGRYVPR